MKPGNGKAARITPPATYHAVFGKIPPAPAPGIDARNVDIVELVGGAKDDDDDEDDAVEANRRRHGSDDTLPPEA